MFNFIYRLIKGSPLTWSELDGNFRQIADQAATKEELQEAIDHEAQAREDLAHRVDSSILYYKNYEDASIAATSLPDGQIVEAPDEDGISYSYSVLNGSLTDKTQKDIKYKQDIPSPPTRSALQFFRENWSIGDIGTPAAGGDWTAVFQKIASQVDPGTHIRLQDDTYFIEADCAFPQSGLKLIGFGPSHTIIKRAPGGTLTDSCLILLGGSSGQIFEGFTLDGDAANHTTIASGLRVASNDGGVSYATLRNIHFKDWGGGDRYTDFAAGLHSYSATGLRTEMCRASGNNHYGLNFFENIAPEVALCYSEGNGKHGFGAAGILGGTFIGLISRDNGMNNYWFRALQDVNITGCSGYLTNPAINEIFCNLQLKGTEQGSITGLNNVTVTGFNAYGARSNADAANPLNGSAGIALSLDTGATAKNVKITGGVIDGGYMGIKILNGGGYHVSGVTVSRTTDRPIYDAGSQSVKISDMTIVDCQRGSYSRGRNSTLTDWKVNSTVLKVGETHHALTVDDTFGTDIVRIEASSTGGTVSFSSAVNLTGSLSNVRAFNNALKSGSTPAVLNNSATPTQVKFWDNYNSSNIEPTAPVRYSDVYMVGSDITSPGIYSGVGSPEGVIAARPGSIYLRRDAASGIPAIYVKEQFQSANGWVAK